MKLRFYSLKLALAKAVRIALGLASIFLPLQAARANCEDALFRKVSDIAHAEENQRFFNHDGTLSIPIDDFLDRLFGVTPPELALQFSETVENPAAEDRELWTRSARLGVEMGTISAKIGSFRLLEEATGEIAQIRKDKLVFAPMLKFLIQRLRSDDKSPVELIRFLHTHPPSLRDYNANLQYFSKMDLFGAYELKLLMEIGGLTAADLEMQILYENENGRLIKKTWFISRVEQWQSGHYDIFPTHLIKLDRIWSELPKPSRLAFLEAYLDKINSESEEDSRE